MRRIASSRTMRSTAEALDAPSEASLSLLGAAFALTFALGVATGLVQVFGFGTNWASYSRYVGDVFGSVLVLHGIRA